jgi:DNA polymerase III delta subunit
LDDGAEPLMLLGLIASNFRRLSLAKEMMTQGVDRKEIMRIIRLLPPMMNFYSKDKVFTLPIQNC